MSISRQSAIVPIAVLAPVIALFCASATVSAQTPAAAQPKSLPQATKAQPLSAIPQESSRILSLRDLATMQPGLFQGPVVGVAPELNAKAQTCFTMRSYRFKRDPDSDAVTPAGSSTCELATQFQMKRAVAAPAKSR